MDYLLAADAAALTSATLALCSALALCLAGAATDAGAAADAAAAAGASANEATANKPNREAIRRDFFMMNLSNGALAAD
jgi:hypothetical protein